jgi:CheY-like chemotaxis protein
MISRIWLIQAPGIARSTLSQRLREDGFLVDELDGVDAALALVGKSQPPRVILFCLLTGAESAARFARVLASRPDWAEVPVLGLTTLAQPQPTAPVLEPWLAAARVLCGEG